MQHFYGMALRQHKGNAKGMAQATRAILKHYTSTPATHNMRTVLLGKNPGVASKGTLLVTQIHISPSKILFRMQWLKLSNLCLTN